MEAVQPHGIVLIKSKTHSIKGKKNPGYYNSPDTIVCNIYTIEYLF
jgi:hypothetical protein